MWKKIYLWPSSGGSMVVCAVSLGVSLMRHTRGSMGLVPAPRLFNHPQVDSKGLGDIGIGYAQPVEM